MNIVKDNKVEHIIRDSDVKHGTCPVCGSTDLDYYKTYGDEDFGGDGHGVVNGPNEYYLTYSVMCCGCNADFSECRTFILTDLYYEVEDD